MGPHVSRKERTWTTTLADTDVPHPPDLGPIKHQPLLNSSTFYVISVEMYLIQVSNLHSASASFSLGKQWRVRRMMGGKSNWDVCVCMTQEFWKCDDITPPRALGSVGGYAPPTHSLRRCIIGIRNLNFDLQLAPPSSILHPSIKVPAASWTQPKLLAAPPYVWLHDMN